jgi:hypothetical protein
VNLPVMPRRAVLGLGVLAASCAIAACGASSAGSTTTKAASGSTTTAASSGGTSSSLTAFRTCLAKHGVTLPSKPAGAGSGTTTDRAPSVGSSSGGRGFAANPKLRAAIQACGGGGFRPGANGNAAFSHTTIDNFVACVRKNGYPQMPNPNFSGTGSVFPRSVESNAKFKTASRTCASVLRPSNSPSAGASAAASA